LNADGDRGEPEYLVVGHVARAHGTRGEALVRSLTDYPEATFVAGVTMALGPRERAGPDPDLPRLTVTSVRRVHDGYLVRFEGVEDRDHAASLRGLYIYRPLAELEPLGDDEWFRHELVGLEVRTAGGSLLGEVAVVHDFQPVELLEVRGPEKEYLIPFREGIVIEVDPDAGRITVDPPEGLLDL